MLRFLLASLFLIAMQLANAQGPQITISGDFQATKLELFINQLEKEHNIQLFYPNEVQNIFVDQQFNDTPILQAFQKILSGTTYALQQYDNKNYVIVQENVLQVAERETAGAESFDGDQVVTFNGYIRDGNTGEGLIGATVFLSEIAKGTSTNTSGFFSLDVPAGNYQVSFNSIGYGEEFRNIVMRSNTTVDINLLEKTVQLNSITIFDKSLDENVSSTQMGKSEINIKTLKSIPPFLGEVDVFKGVLLLPGVSSIGEGASGFNVRGGSVDQNLILMDGAPIFNPTHLFGFFSAFNGDIVNNVTLYRGGIPAQYGGRLSSILDVSLKEGNKEEIKGWGGIGLVSARFALEGPIIKDKSSFVVSGRSSYSDYLLKSLRIEELTNSSAHFYDINAKINHQLNDKNSIFFSSYMSGDGFSFSADTTFSWFNRAATLNWNHLFNDSFVGSFSGVFSNYNYQVDGKVPSNEYTLSSNINFASARGDFTYVQNEASKYDFGAAVEHYSITPGDLIPGEDSSILPFQLQVDRSIETSIYLNHEREIWPGASLMLGVRYANFNNIGPTEVFQYAENEPRTDGSIVDTLRYNSGEVVQSYGGFEPRVALKIGLPDNSSLKLGYNRMRQYIHLISNTAAVTPIDVWKLSNNYLQPQTSDQFGLGYFKNFNNNTIETSIEVYYKQMQNILDYKDGASLLLNSAIESDLLPGIGRAYGVEMMVNKTMGRLTGWLSYTYSRSLLQVDGEFPEEKINGGEWYPANFDKPHDFTLSGVYRLNKRISIGANFTYSTGRPVTYPTGLYNYQGFLVIKYSDRNQFRIPDYHRLDLSLTIEGSHKKNKKWHGSYTFSVYNVYSRNNAYSVFIRPSGFVPQAYQLSIMAVAFPSFTYNFRF